MSLRLRRTAPRALGALLLALVALVALPATTAGAHAALVAADPPDGARLDTSPAEVRLTFSEHVSASLGGVRVVDADGQRVDRGAVRVEDRDVSVDLAPDLPDGTYVITYRIVSADGHPVRGASVFGVGDAEVDASVAERLGGPGDDRRWEVARRHRARPRLRRHPARRRGRRCSSSSPTAAATSAALLVRIVRAARRWSADSAGSWPSRCRPRSARVRARRRCSTTACCAPCSTTVWASGWAWPSPAWPSRCSPSTAAARWPPPAPRWRPRPSPPPATPRAGDVRWLATTADVVHLLVVAVWGGGLVLLWFCLRSRRRAAAAAGPGASSAEAADTPAVVARFSTMATVAIVAAGITGLTLGWSEVRSLDALTGTGYGQLLLVKAGVVAVIAALGAYNHFRLVPAMGQGKAKAALARLGPTLRLEALALLVVVGLTAVLVVVTPARTEAAGGPVERIIDLGDVGSVQLVVAPARAGFNQIHLYTFDPAGRPAELAEIDRARAGAPGRRRRSHRAHRDAGRSRARTAERERPRARRDLADHRPRPHRPLHRGIGHRRGADRRLIATLRTNP